MFRMRQKLRIGAGACVSVPSVSVGDDGFIKHSVKRADLDLPDPSMYDLGLLLKSGVPLQQVNSKVLDERASFDASSLASDDKKIDKKIDDNSVQPQDNTKE